MTTTIVFNCDRCNILIKNYADRFSIDTGPRQEVQVRKDLCIKCYKKFEEFMKGNE